ncbi:Six-hairpin glycosidase-like protein [Syncephalastrum racemosum]|uniref:Trehalase n=1 Tax=Syncephalastrum racemosum TaxID=13706 RepID=A0A1X2H6J7_SYNRA|nr:Six-hairpin glycosidase-like protein [Syncephalastrum racemosum]
MVCISSPRRWSSALLFAAGISAAAAASSPSTNSSSSKTCDSPIYCDGPLLKTVQLAALYPDSKTFVDKPTSKPLNDVLSAFNALGDNPSKDKVQSFVNDNFLEEGTELRPVNLTVKADLPLLDTIDDLTYRGWASQVHQYWANLTFEFDTSFLCEGCVSSTLPVNRPFVVPGGRFREFYYWDSYFVIRGLLLSELNDLAKDMLENFLDFVEEYGFIPNGARIYYLNRSQPPFLTEMIKSYYNATGDNDFVQKALPTLDKEYAFWMANTTVEIDDHVLNRYIVHNTSPRPESYLEDYETAQNTTVNPEDLFSDLATGAETGWDYSSRWTRFKTPVEDDPNAYHLLRSLNTRSIIPVELNALLWSMETTLAGWHREGSRKQKYYKRQAAKRLTAMEEVLWNDDDATFYDYNITSGGSQKTYSPAVLFPYWLGAVPNRIKKDKNTLERVFDQTRSALEKYPGVLTTTFENTTLQWDFPNGWPPLQFVAMEAMRNVDAWTKKSQFTPMADVLAERYIASAFCSWYETGGSVPGQLQKLSNQTDVGHMFEKLSVTDIGNAGGGGEYTVQAGFGWTNGIALWIFDTFDASKFRAPECDQNPTYSLSSEDSV